MVTLLFFLIFIFFANAYFECDDTTKQCNCTSGVCNKVCTDYNKCQNYQFYCSNQSNSCSVACLHSNSCQNAKFYLQSTSSSVRCLGPASCSNSFFECGSRNTCVLESDPYSFIQSQFVCNGHINHINECRFQVLNATTYGLLSCAINANESVTCEMNEVGLLSCPQSSSTCSTIHNCSGPLCGNIHFTALTPLIPLINITADNNEIKTADKCGGFVAFFDSNTNIWIITIVFMIGLLSSFILYYCCLSLFFVGDKRDTYNNNIIVDGDKSCDKCSDNTEGKVDKIGRDRHCSEINHFESSFWFTILSTLFNDEDQTDGIDCGLILIPAHIAIYEILNSIFSGCIQCKVPVTQQFLKHYGKTSRKANSYIVIQSGYIYAHEIYKKSKTICELANNYIVIDSQKRHTQKHNNIYYRIFVNHFRVKSAGEFCNVLQQQHGITINLSKESTTTWTRRESLELSLDFFESKAAGMEATTLANALHYLQERRRDRTESGEMLGATIVVIPYDKTLQDYKLYLRQYLNVSILVSDSSLLCIFTHTSVLHDGAIFVRGNRIIAVKAFFRITGQYKKKACIGHGTRHASAQEFTKHAKSHNPVTFVLSEEDGLIRSCIAGQLKKIDYKFIPRSVMEHHHHSHKFHEEKTIKTRSNVSNVDPDHVDEDDNDLKQEQKQQDHEEEQTEGTEGTEGNNIQLTSINYTNSATQPHANGTVDDDDGYDDI